VHVNLLRPAAVPSVLGMHPKVKGAISQPERIPWINTEIIIFGGRVLRTYPGIVKDVLVNQPTPSGLKLVIEITALDSTAPFRRITLDYDHVVEARWLYFELVEPLLILTNSRGVKLHHFAPPTSELFIPRTSELPKLLPKLLPALFLPQPSLNTPGNTTPAPEPSLSSSPAWDPSSRTPRPDPNHSFAHLSSPALPVDPGHPLLDPRLLNAKVRVVVTGGDYNEKELTASVLSIDGRLSI
jgi:hypothetical protein